MGKIPYDKDEKNFDKEIKSTNAIINDDENIYNSIEKGLTSFINYEIAAYLNLKIRNELDENIQIPGEDFFKIYRASIDSDEENRILDRLLKLFKIQELYKNNRQL